MNRIYFDNTATTAIDPAVFEEMKPYFTEKFGNPSSIYSYGRETRLAIENARKTVAQVLHAHPSEIFFTSCGTESTNTALHGAVEDLGCRHIITSPVEHHATLHTVDYLVKTRGVKASYVRVSPKGYIDLEDLETILEESKEKCLVTLMHGNNEIGTRTDIKAVSEICEKYKAIFHSDTVQTLGHFPIDVSSFKIHFLSGSAHKFHGPKGVGILYVNRDIKISPYLEGGGQEREMRSGTENVYGIVGLAKALQMASDNMEEDSGYIRGLRDYMKKKLEEGIPGVCFNGDPEGDSLYTVLSVGFPKTDKSDMLLFNLDLHHVCASGGSACSAGALTGSHVIAAIHPKDQTTIRFSFSKFNTKEEVDQVIEILKKIL
ncbi:MAG: cysteine desulfurase [Chitinophagaceae bacterium]|nr:cysteine desulfurase [Chitinophagaceae bacterium]